MANNREWRENDPATPLSAARMTGMENDITAALGVPDAALATRLGSPASQARAVLDGLYASETDLQAVEDSIPSAGTSAATPNTIVRRDSAGNIKAAAPVAATDVATRSYVDNVLAPAAWPAVIGAKAGFIGDSYTAGLGLASPSTERWSKLFATMAGATEENRGVSSSGYLNEGVGGNSRFATQAALLGADCTHVIICGGINDAPLIAGSGKSAFQTAVTATINAAKAAAPAAAITIISPMWMASAPSADLLTVESYIREVIPAGVKFIEGGPWLRVDRTEWQQGDGHPNAAGSVAIANWVRDQFGGGLPGAVFHQEVRPGTSDLAVNTTNFPGYVLISATIKGAKSGWWDLEGQGVFYGVANGFIALTETARKVQLRHDTTSNPSVLRHKLHFYHPGGDLLIKLHYDPSAGATTAITNGQTKIWARNMGPSNV